MIRAVVRLLLLLQPALLGAQWVDPSGDTLIEATYPALDLTDVEAKFSPGAWTITLTVNSAGITTADVESAIAFIDLDTDLDVGTGYPTHMDSFELPGPVMGVDAWIQLTAGSRVAELYVIDNSTGVANLVDFYDVTVDGFTISVTVPRAVPSHGFYLGARYGLAVLLGNQDWATDIAPDEVNAWEAEPAPGDFDEDGDVDDEEVSHLRDCRTGANVPQTLGTCLDAKLDGDEDVDMDDFGILQEQYTGSY